MQNMAKMNAANVVRLIRAQKTITSVPSRALSSTTTIEHKAVPPPAQGNEVFLFGPKDMRLPLPGDVGIPASELRPGYSYRRPLDKKCRNLSELDMYRVDTGEDRQRKVYEKFIDASLDSTSSLPSDDPRQSGSSLEFKAQECPLLVKQDFQKLFPDRDVLNSPVTVISLTFKSEFDDFLESGSLEADRDQVSELFVTKAKFIVAQLTSVGYWADYINPFSAKPHLNGEFVNDVLFETDERYRNFGFSIEDSGHCKITKHHNWGENDFVGCLFTNAPLNSPPIRSLMAAHNQ